MVAGLGLQQDRVIENSQIIMVIIEAIFTYHAIICFEVNTSVSFSTATMLSNLHPHLAPEHFHHSKENPIPQPQATTIPVSWDLPIWTFCYGIIQCLGIIPCLSFFV